MKPLDASILNAGRGKRGTGHQSVRWRSIRKMNAEQHKNDNYLEKHRESVFMIRPEYTIHGVRLLHAAQAFLQLADAHLLGVMHEAR